MGLLTTAQAVMIFFPFSGIHTYVAVFVMVGMLGGWANICFLIIELRVPPTSVGSVTLLCGVAGVAACTVAPTITNLEQPMPLVVSVIISILSFISTFFLPPPGLYLPNNENDATHLEKCKEAVTVL